MSERVLHIEICADASGIEVDARWKVKRFVPQFLIVWLMPDSVTPSGVG